MAVLLNLLPGLGTGYIYQRRWKEYWITGIFSFGWIFLSFIRQLSLDPVDPLLDQNDQFGLIGLMAISFATSLEAGLAVNKAREEIKD